MRLMLDESQMCSVCTEVGRMLFDDVVGESMWWNGSQMWMMSCEEGKMLWDDVFFFEMGSRRTKIYSTSRSG